MPYKHIASHLRKTELACRLHFHQMSYSSPRGKRTDSVSSVNSFLSLTPDSARQSRSLEHSPRVPICSITSPPSTPENNFTKPATYPADPPGLRSERLTPVFAKPRIDEPKNLLPAPELSRCLRLDTTFASPDRSRIHERDRIDLARILLLYQANRQSFWTLIASQYSAEGRFSPQQLESAFLAEQTSQSIVRASFPPTPDPTPKRSLDPSYSAPALTAVDQCGFSAVNRTPVISSAISAPSPGRCAVSALLNDPVDHTLVR